jgi:hypothetical protein
MSDYARPADHSGAGPENSIQVVTFVQEKHGPAWPERSPQRA